MSPLIKLSLLSLLVLSACAGADDAPSAEDVGSVSSELDQPYVFAMTPSFGPNGGRNDIKIQGFNFALLGQTTMTFNGRPAISVDCFVSTECSVHVPFYGPTSVDAPVDVEVSVLGKPAIFWQELKYVYKAGPACSVSFSCGALDSYPRATVSCPSEVAFYVNYQWLSIGTSKTFSSSRLPLDVWTCEPERFLDSCSVNSISTQQTCRTSRGLPFN